MLHIPKALSELSGDWLAHVLDAPVTGFKVLDAHAGTTGRAVLQLEYAEPVGLPPRLFVKLPPTDELQRAFVTSSGMGRREARFYESLSAEVPMRVPRCYFAASDDSGEEYIMLLEPSISEGAAAELRTLPAGSVPDGALSDLTPVSDMVTLGPVFTGQVLIQPVFGTQQEAAGGLTLPEGTMGVSIQLGDPQRVAGFVKPGSEIALFTTGSGLNGQARQQTTILLPRVLIAAVGPTVIAQSAEGSGNSEEIPTAIMTLALDQEEAQKVILASQTTDLYMGLLDAESEIDPNLRGATSANLLN